MALKGTGQFAQFATVYTGESLDIHNTSSTGEFSTGDEVLIYDSSLGENRKILRGNFFNGLEGDYISIHGTFEETTPATNMELLVYDPSVPANRRMTRANFLDGISAVGAFTDLTDTPASYEGYDETYYVRVNAASNALEFATVPSSYTLPVATDSILGGIKIGSRLTITDGVLSADEQSGTYTLPTASADTLGGVKIGSGITITDGVISAASGGGDVTGPASTTENKIPQWDSTNKKLKDGLAIGTTTGTLAAGDDSRFTNARTPTAHNLIDTTGHPVSGLTTGHFLKATGATTYAFGAHGLTAGDVGAATTSTKLDDFGTPDDNTDLNATTDRHGLLPKLGGGTTNFLRADGTWAAPTASGGGITWNEVTGTTQSAAADNGYICNNAALVTVTLPSTCALGKTIRVAGKGAGGWKIAQNASQQIHFGDQSTTSGTGGSISSGYKYDAIELVCITADTTFLVISAVGTVDVV